MWKQFIIFQIVFLVAIAFAGTWYLYLRTKLWLSTDLFYPVLHFINVYKLTIALGVNLGGCSIIFLINVYQMKKIGEKEINEAKKVALDEEQRKNDLIVYLAHDLKTPLTSVLGYLELLQEEEVPEKARQKYVEVVYRKAERLEELINEFFEITRFNLTHVVLEKSTINLSRVLEQTLFDFQPMMSEKEIKPNVNIEKDIMYSCDPDKIQRVFDNLLRNAMNYSYRESELIITVKEENDQLLLEFGNQGPTIPEEKLNRIFEQFFRMDQSRGTKDGGSGVGLAIAKDIVELHGGKISAKSENEWIWFYIELPRNKM